MMCLGVMKKLMRLWFKIKGTQRASQGLITEIEKASALLKHDCPSDFINKIRGFDTMTKFKAKEYRAILGYWGMVVFKKYISKDQYSHFMLFSCAFRILASDFAQDEIYVSYAHKLLDEFVRKYGTLYAENEMVRNVHGLLHIVDDVRRYGRLDDFSAFKFESFLAPLKNLIHGPSDPLAQVWNKVMAYRAADKSIINATKSLNHGPDFQIKISNRDEECFKKLVLPKITLSTKHPNNIVMLSDGKPFVIEKIVKTSPNDGVIRGRRYRKHEDLFNAPLKSSRLNIYLATGPTGKIITKGISKIRFKCISTEIKKNKYAIIPLLHF